MQRRSLAINTIAANCLLAYRVAEQFRRAANGSPTLSTSVIYDFILPGDLLMNPPQGPIPSLNKGIQFKVDGKATDSLAVTIGQEQIGEVEWPWITASVELIQGDGDTLETELFVLMDGDRIDGLAKAVAFQIDHNPAPDIFKDCTNKTVGVLEEALAAPGKKSPASASCVTG